MAYTITYYEIRESDSVKFWHEIDKVRLVFSEFHKKLKEMGYPCEETISDDKLIYIKKASFESREELEWVISQHPIENYIEKRNQYNIENNILSFLNEDFE